MKSGGLDSLHSNSFYLFYNFCLSADPFDEASIDLHSFEPRFVTTEERQHCCTLALRNSAVIASAQCESHIILGVSEILLL